MKFAPRLQFEANPGGAMSALFWEQFLRDGFGGYYERAWDTDGENLDQLEVNMGRLVMRMRDGPHSEGALIEAGDGLIRAGLSHGRIWVQIATQSPVKALQDDLLHRIQELLPVAPPPPPEHIWLTFWTQGRHGAIRLRRQIVTPNWAEIEGNYPPQTRGRLAGMMDAFEPAHGGQLVLWHGVPGTGKTFAIRALGQEWREWCGIEVIIDPEAFFGDASYMMEVLIGGDGRTEESTEPATPRAAKDVSAESRRPRGGWRLLILEDTGELLTADAKARAGQALSRLLNVVDGLIGQGLQILMLVTTNEPFRDLHPAVGRPGRCAAEVEFAKFSADEALDWLEAHGVCGQTASEATLAEVYGRLHEFQGARHRHPIGFVMAGVR